MLSLTGSDIMIRYSIVIPVYNVELYLEDCLNSIIAQDSASIWEAILIDDGSTDESGHIFDVYAARDIRFRVIHQNNQGLPSARNTGMEVATGEYLLFLDSDDIWKPELLSFLDGEINDKSDIIGFQYENCDETGYILETAPSICLHSTQGCQSGKMWLKMQIESGYGFPSCVWRMAYRTAFINQEKLRFDESLKCAEDDDFNTRAIMRAISIRVIDKKLYIYRCRKDSIVHTMSIEKRADVLEVIKRIFYMMPIGAVADTFFGSAIRMSTYGSRNETQCLAKLYYDNIEIVQNVTSIKRKVCCCLIDILDVYTVSKLYMTLNQIKTLFRRWLL